MSACARLASGAVELVLVGALVALAWPLAGWARDALAPIVGPAPYRLRLEVFAPSGSPGHRMPDPPEGPFSDGRYRLVSRGGQSAIELPDGRYVADFPWRALGWRDGYDAPDGRDVLLLDDGVVALIQPAQVLVTRRGGGPEFVDLFPLAAPGQLVASWVGAAPFERQGVVEVDVRVVDGETLELFHPTARHGRRTRLATGETTELHHRPLTRGQVWVWIAGWLAALVLVLRRARRRWRGAMAVVTLATVSTALLLV